MTAPDRLLLPSGTLPLDRVQIMGILNRTPDSFYDGGRYSSLESAVTRAVRMAEEGAGIIDVGGEKAGPGAAVSVQEEIERVVPAIEAVVRETGLAVSVDTFKPEVARPAVEAGASIINGIDGFRDPAMRRVAAETGAAAVIMHIQGQPRVANPNPVYGDVAVEVRDFLVQQAQACERDGISPDRIVIDPGPGFGKTSEHDIAVLRRLDLLTALPYPVLLAVSRKKFIGDLLGLPVEERLEGSLAVTAWAVMQGARIVRTHDVLATTRVVRMTEAVMHPELVAP